MSETISPALQATIPYGERGTGTQAIRGSVPEALFAYGGEAIARPSMAGRYVVPDLEMGFQGIDLEYDFGPVGARRRDIQFNFDKESGGVVVRMVLPDGVAERALVHARLAATWNLRSLLEAVNQATQEATSAVGQMTREAFQAMPKVARDPALPIAGRVRGASSADLTPTRIVEKVASTEVKPLSDDASVAEMTAMLTQLTGLPDRELGRLFPGQISREHFQRWRTGKSDNPTGANRRRMWFLLRLFERLASEGVAVRDWLRNPTALDERTPYDLLRLGRFDEVEQLAAQMLPTSEPVEIVSSEGHPILLEQEPAVFALRTDEPEDDLIYEEEDGWIEIEEDLDDETDDA